MFSFRTSVLFIPTGICSTVKVFIKPIKQSTINYVCIALIITGSQASKIYQKAAQVKIGSTWWRIWSDQISCCYLVVFHGVVRSMPGVTEEGNTPEWGLQK